MSDTVILGCGYTGERVARRLLSAGVRVVATSPRTGDLADLAALGADIVRVDARDADTLATLGSLARGCRDVAVLCCVPPLAVEGGLIDATATMLAPLAPARVVYLSTASVYGDEQAVDATTPARPESASHHARLAAERAVLGGPWSGMVLRPGAIYGPWRGIHSGAPLRRATEPATRHAGERAVLIHFVGPRTRGRTLRLTPAATVHPARPRGGAERDPDFRETRTRRYLTDASNSGSYASPEKRSGSIPSPAACVAATPSMPRTLFRSGKRKTPGVTGG